MKPFVVLISALLMGMAAPSYAKIESPCSVSSMLTSFTPCMSFLINASPSKPIPTSQCCKSLKALINGGMNCLCDFVCGNIPFTIPFNKTLATFLPHACNISDVLLQCKCKISHLLPWESCSMLCSSIKLLRYPFFFRVICSLCFISSFSRYCQFTLFFPISMMLLCI